jgi:hypothetical protein
MSADGLALNVRFLRLESIRQLLKMAMEGNGIQRAPVAIAVLTAEFFERDAYFFVGDLVALSFQISLLQESGC